MTVVKPIHHTQEEPSRDKVLWEDRMFDKPRVYVEILLLLFSVFLLSFSGMGLLLIWHPLLYLSHSLVYHSIVFTEQKVVVKPAFLRRKRTFWYSELTLIEVQMIKRRQWKKRGWHSSLTLKIILTGFSGTKSFKIVCLTHPLSSDYLNLTKTEALECQDSFEQSLRNLEGDLPGLVKIHDETIHEGLIMHHY